jgi:hypothetical protein
MATININADSYQVIYLLKKSHRHDLSSSTKTTVQPRMAMASNLL